MTKINVKDASDKIVGSQIKINSRQNQSIWIIFETDEENLDNIPSQLDGPKNYEKGNKMDNKPSGGEEIDVSKKKQIFDVKKEFLDSYFEMNGDFIYIEPKLIPIIPGDDPSIINKVSEFSEDTF